MKKDLDITKPRYRKHIFSSPLALRYIEVPLYLERTCKTPMQKRRDTNTDELQEER